MIALRAFQTRFIKAATAPGIDTAAMSLPRGNGKSFLASQILTRVLMPGDDLFRPGTRERSMRRVNRTSKNRFQIRSREFGTNGGISIFGFAHSDRDHAQGDEYQASGESARTGKPRWVL